MTDASAGHPAMGQNPHAIARISVENLFGQFTYQLPARGDEQPDLSNLFILYGDRPCRD